jgi:hypothetical protein
VPAVLSPVSPAADKDSAVEVCYFQLHSFVHSSVHYNRQEEDNEHAAHVQLHFKVNQDIVQLEVVHVESKEEVAKQKVVEQALLAVQ